MKKLYLLTATLVFVTSVALSAQTKFVAHKSHSGTSETFTLAQPGNMGLPSNYFEDPVIDTTEQDSTGITPPSTPQNALQNHLSPTIPDSTQQMVEPESDSTKPNMSNEQGTPAKGSAMNEEKGSERFSERGGSGLLLLALGLGLPIAGITLRAIRHRDRMA